MSAVSTRVHPSNYRQSSQERFSQPSVARLKLAKAYLLLGRSPVSGDQYSRSPLVSADTTTWRGTLYCITWTGLLWTCKARNHLSRGLRDPEVRLHPWPTFSQVILQNSQQLHCGAALCLCSPCMSACLEGQSQRLPKVGVRGYRVKSSPLLTQKVRRYYRPKLHERHSDPKGSSNSNQRSIRIERLPSCS